MLITVADTPISIDEMRNLEKEDAKLRAEFLEQLDAAINLSLDEKFTIIPRSKVMREPILLSD